VAQQRTAHLHRRPPPQGRQAAAWQSSDRRSGEEMAAADPLDKGISSPAAALLPLPLLRALPLLCFSSPRTPDMAAMAVARCRCSRTPGAPQARSEASPRLPLLPLQRNRLRVPEVAAAMLTFPAVVRARRHCLPVVWRPRPCRSCGSPRVSRLFVPPCSPSSLCRRRAPLWPTSSASLQAWPARTRPTWPADVVGRPTGQRPWVKRPSV
jgi:hypothetical protein